jgi:1,4-dihydroxy-2-naphthoate octaprenyltransferase
MAIRPKTLTTAIIPFVIGSFLAKASFANMKWELTWFAILSAICIQIGTNLINDAQDFQRGADKETRLGPKRVTQSGLLSVKQVQRAGLGFFSLAFFSALPLIAEGGIPLLLIIVLSIICGYAYTAGPFPIAYSGFSELFVLIFYGFVSVCSMVYLQEGFIDMKAFLASIQIGFLATTLLAINNLRDHVDDAKANKKTLAVRYGVNFAKWEITTLILFPFFLNPLWLTRQYWLTAALPYLALPLGITIIKLVWSNEPGRLYIRFLGLVALLHLSFGILMAIGLFFQ